MTGGPWTLSMKVVHGAGPKWGSMFCPHPFHGFMLTNNALLIKFTVHLCEQSLYFLKHLG